MKHVLLPPFYTIFNHYKPTTICEIGTHDGKSAVQFVDYCLKFNPKLLYVGYDIFDSVSKNKEFHKKEINGKGAGNYLKAYSNLKHRKSKSKTFKFRLFVGLTTETLEHSKYDFVYIDGGHSYETVKHDYEKLKDSQVIVFDDYQTEGVKRFFDELITVTNMPEVTFEKGFTNDKTCWAFMPNNGTVHIQTIIFNKEFNLQ